MEFIITFLEGFISFISPCMLPMFPLYMSYFAGGEIKKKNVVSRAVAFVAGFTLIFCAMGVFAGSVGSFLNRYHVALRVIGGLLIVFFGLSYLGLIRLPTPKGVKTVKTADCVFSAFLFGIAYSLSLTPCVGVFLGAALTLASTSGTAVLGFWLLMAYSLGLGIPFVISAVLIEKLNKTFDFIKKSYKIINLVCGIFLVAVGVLMAAGLLDAAMSVFSLKWR